MLSATQARRARIAASLRATSENVPPIPKPDGPPLPTPPDIPQPINVPPTSFSKWNG